jgi:class 3 adenylate cyclase
MIPADPAAAAGISTVQDAAIAAEARDLLARGQAPLACELLRPRLDRGDVPAPLRYLAALAQARVGALDSADRWVGTLSGDMAAADLRSDVLALGGRIAKDRWSRLPPGPARDAAADAAIRAYQQAWDESRDPFPGVNAATLLAISGDRSAAHALAESVRARCESADNPQLPLWREATLGELCVLLGDFDEAARHYAAAARAAGARRGDVASMRRQLRLMRQALAIPLFVDEALHVPRVVVCAGHMIDRPGRAAVRFPPQLAGPLQQALREVVNAMEAGVGYCSAACGTDLLFVEAMLERGAEVHLVLPFAAGDFRALCVDYAGPEWGERFDRVLKEVNSLTCVVDENFLGDTELFEHAGRLMQGAAWLRAEALQTEAVMLSVMDPDALPLPGGTRALSQAWEALGRRIHVIDLVTLRRDTRTPVGAGQASPDASLPVRSGMLRREIAAMLFADMVGFSKLQEEDTPAYLTHFLGAIAELLERFPTAPLAINTWGDGVFVAFASAGDAASFALDVRDAVRGKDWAASGLPGDTRIRIGMHVGPVFRVCDPLTGRMNVFGSHVTRAARIEPIVPPGDILVSEEMACVLAAERNDRIATDYLGRTPLAKAYTSRVLYRLRRWNEAE